MMLTSVSGKFLYCGNTSRSANSMYEHGTDLVMSSWFSAKILHNLKNILTNYNNLFQVMSSCRKLLGIFCCGYYGRNQQNKIREAGFSL